MKSIKFLILGLTALSTVGAASAADVTVRFTGSSAYRSSVHSAILAKLPGCNWGVVGTDTAKPTYAIYSGTMSGFTGNVTIQATWTGSEAGVQTVSNQANLNVTFLPASLVTSGSLNAAAMTSLADPTVGGNPNDTVQADIDLADTYQATSQFNGTYKGVNYPVLAGYSGGGTDGIVGVAGFKWVASNAPSGFTNMTSQLANQLYTTGKLPLSFFTGASADATRDVYAMGRNPDSGTRLTAFAETGRGATSLTKQYQPLYTGTAGLTVVTGTGTPIEVVKLWPIETINGISTSLSGNSGYDSGGKLAKGALGNTLANSGTIHLNTTGGAAIVNPVFVGYLSKGDATDAIAAGAKELTYNGVTYSDTVSTGSIQNGTYSFWGYEHMYYGASVTGDKLTVGDAIGAQILGTSASIKISTMTNSGVTTQRDGDGQPIHK